RLRQARVGLEHGAQEWHGLLDASGVGQEGGQVDARLDLRRVERQRPIVSPLRLVIRLLAAEMQRTEGGVDRAEIGPRERVVRIESDRFLQHLAGQESYDKAQRA